MTQKAAPDPRSFYNRVMPEKYGSDYESARWQANLFLSAQYRMMVDVMNRYVLPSAAHVTRVLEVGPGPGTWTKRLLAVNPSAQYTLVDISSKMLSQAKGSLAGHTNVEFVESDLLLFEALQPYDFFFSSRAIEYMPDKPAVVQKIASSLVPGGCGAIVTKTPKPLFDRMRGRASSTLHSAQIQPGELMRLMRANGLVVEKVRIATATVPLLGSAALNESVYRLFRHFPLFFPLTLLSESYLVTFRKLA